MRADREISLRRTLQQAKHCLEEALSIVENVEDYRCALDDVRQAQELLAKVVVPELKARAPSSRP